MDDTMKMRNILSIEQSGESVASSSAGFIKGDDTNNLDNFGLTDKQNGDSANAVNSDTVNEIGFPEVLPCTDITGEETERVGFNSGEAEPTNFVADAEGRAEWDEFYKLAWKFKNRLMKEYHGRVSFPISDDDMLRIFQK